MAAAHSNCMLMCLQPSLPPLSSVDWIPLVRELVSLGVFLLSLALGSSLSLLVMAVAWLRYHPLYGLAILLAAASPFLISKLLTHKNDQRKAS